MIEIVPAILPKSVTDLEINLVRIENAGGTVQVDMVDGVYAKNKPGRTLRQARLKRLCRVMRVCRTGGSSTSSLT